MQLDNFIQNAEQRIFSESDLPLDRKNSTGNTTANNKYLSTPDDFLSTYSLSIVSSEFNDWYILVIIFFYILIKYIIVYNTSYIIE